MSQKGEIGTTKLARGVGERSTALNGPVEKSSSTYSGCASSSRRWRLPSRWFNAQVGRSGAGNNVFFLKINT